MKNHATLLALFLLCSGDLVAARDDFRLGTVAARPGTSVAGRIDVSGAGATDETFIPITVAHGARPGPVLALIAGIHGAEYSPILALQKLRSSFDPAELSGTVVMVHAANLPAFLGRTIYYSPGDWKNLNRSFPGKADGTLTERIAHVLTQEVIGRADYVMDIHSGDANEKLRPSYVGYYAEAGGADVIERSKRMAVAFGLDTIVVFKGDLDPDRAIWCGSAAGARGIPSIDIESGELGLIEERRIEPIVDGIISVMRDLEMLAGEPSPALDPVFIDERAYVKSEYDGIWYPDSRIEAGQFVSKGARLGTLTDFHGNVLLEARAPESGMLLIMLGTPPVNAGETLAVIANVQGEPW